MYYQVLIETNNKVGKSKRNQQFFELDKTNLQEIKDDIIRPFIEKKEFEFDGYFLTPKEIARIKVKTTKYTSKECSKDANERLSRNIIMYISPTDIVSDDKYATDITKDVMKSVQSLLSFKENDSKKKKMETNKSEVFIVHGHDDLAKIEIARFIEKLNLKAIILHEQPNKGRTIIEKFEDYTNVGFGIVLYTPCDLGSSSINETKPNLRARQNVVFEHGYLIGKIGRENVCALIKGDIEKPSDLSGIIYIDMDKSMGWKMEVVQEMINAGYDIDTGLIFK